MDTADHHRHTKHLITINRITIFHLCSVLLDFSESATSTIVCPGLWFSNTIITGYTILTILQNRQTLKHAPTQFSSVLVVKSSNTIELLWECEKNVYYGIQVPVITDTDGWYQEIVFWCQDKGIREEWYNLSQYNFPHFIPVIHSEEVYSIQSFVAVYVTGEWRGAFTETNCISLVCLICL